MLQFAWIEKRLLCHSESFRQPFLGPHWLSVTYVWWMNKSVSLTSELGRLAFILSGHLLSFSRHSRNWVQPLITYEVNIWELVSKKNLPVHFIILEYYQSRQQFVLVKHLASISIAQVCMHTDKNMYTYVQTHMNKIKSMFSIVSPGTINIFTKEK